MKIRTIIAALALLGAGAAPVEAATLTMKQGKRAIKREAKQQGAEWVTLYGCKRLTASRVRCRIQAEVFLGDTFWGTGYAKRYRYGIDTNIRWDR